MRRLILVVLVAVVACELSESPTGPTDESAVVRPSFSFTGGSGKVLGSTNQGELIEIDLDAGTATLIGDAGIFDGDSVGWTDIAFDDSGTLFGLSRIFFESDFEVHLYTIDASDGAVLSDLGSIGDHAFSDFDHDGSAFYGNGKEANVFGCCGQLFLLDETAPVASWISPDSTGFGLNPFDTFPPAPNRPITNGGFAVHPGTGELWGIETNSFAPLLFRINRSTGAADSIVPLAVEWETVGGGFDGLHVLDDGTFIATLSGPHPIDSAIWEIDPTLDSLGRAPVNLISLTYDTQIVGNLNGLTASIPPTPQFLVSLSADGGLIAPPSGIGAVATITIDVAVIDDTGTPVPDQAVTLTLDGVEGSGGHVLHQGSMPSGSLSSSTVMTGPSGISSVVYTAPPFGGTIELTGIAPGALAAHESIAVAVSNLVELAESQAVETIGVTGTHPSNHWGTVDMVERLGELADSVFVRYQTPVQVNDMSLELGGKFDLNSEYLPTGGHAEHRVGENADIRTIFSTEAQLRYLQLVWENLGGSVFDEKETSQPHYHLRAR